MLRTVYQDNRREFVTHLGMELYTSLHPAPADAELDGAGQDEDAGAGDAAHVGELEADEADEADEAEAFVQPSQQLVLHSNSGQASMQLAPTTMQQRRLERVPVAHLVSLVPAKRKAGACACLCVCVA